MSTFAFTMKVNWQLFSGLAIFYVIVTIIYWQIGGEPVGIGGMLLSACLAGMVGFYLWFTQKRIGVILPEDNLTAEIIDGAGELGFYSPHSWWPPPRWRQSPAARPRTLDQANHF